MTFRFQEKLVACLIGKFDYFVFDGRAVARPDAFDLARIKRGLVDVGTNGVVDGFIRVSDVAVDLGLGNGFRGEGERDWALVGRLRLKLLPVDCAAVEAWRG